MHVTMVFLALDIWLLGARPQITSKIGGKQNRSLAVIPTVDSVLTRDNKEEGRSIRLNSYLLVC